MKQLSLYTAYFMLESTTNQLSSNHLQLEDLARPSIPASLITVCQPPAYSIVTFMLNIHTITTKESSMTIE